MKTPDFKLSDEQANKILSLPYLSKTMYSNLDVQKTLEYMFKRYINPMSKKIDISKSSLVDCGSGFGWLAFTYLLCGGKSATLCEIDHDRLKDAEAISEILGINDHCTFISSAMQDLEFEDNQFDIFTCIETLEHVGEENIDTCLKVISDSTKSMIILTTPNKLFPLVLHDNKIPLSHWIPSQYRNYYTSLFGLKEKHSNDFVSPLRLNILGKKFKPASSTLTFRTYEDWLQSYPFYSPYNSGNRWKEKPGIALRTLYRLLNLFLGKSSHVFSPNLCRLWVRK